MFDFIFSIMTQTITFLPLAFGISMSYHMMRATDMTIDGSFVLGAAAFASLLTAGFSPAISAIFALCFGALAGMMTAFIQRNGRIDPLLAGVLATFVLSSVNLIIMGKPNINLISEKTLVSSAFAQSELLGWCLTAGYSLFICGVIFILLKSRLGLTLRAFGDNPMLITRLGKNIETYRRFGFALSNLLAAASGCLTAQTVGYADIGMGFGVTLTGIGAIILGRQLISRLFHTNHFRIGLEFLACLIGVILYYLSLNTLLRFDINPIYLKMILGILLVVFLRAAIPSHSKGNS